MLTDIEIAQASTPQRITEIAEKAGIDEKYLECYGNYKAKVDYNLLRNEWGFNGNVVTDSYSGEWGPANWMIRGGGNLALGGASLSYDGNAETATTVSCLREMAHGLLYAHANSLAMNDGSTPTTPKPLSSYMGGTLRTAVVGQAYADTVAKAIINDELYPDASESEIVYEAISELPEGLNVSSDGTVSGTPQETSNSFGFTVKATYMDYSLTASFVISIIDSGGSIVYSAENTDLGVATIGTAWSLRRARATTGPSPAITGSPPPLATGSTPSPARPTATPALTSPPPAAPRSRPAWGARWSPPPTTAPMATTWSSTTGAGPPPCTPT